MCCFSCCHWCCCCCQDWCEDHCDYFDWSDIPDLDDIKQMFLDWREDWTMVLTSQLSRINESLVSQRNEYCVMLCIGCNELAAWILMIVAMADIANPPDFKYTEHGIQWDLTGDGSCNDGSDVLLPLSATLMCLGFFWCCYLCKPDKAIGIICGVLMRYPFAITLCVYCWKLNNRYSYHNGNIYDNGCISFTESSSITWIDSDTFITTPILEILSEIDNSDRIEEIQSYYHRLSIYYTVILALMLPTTILLFFIILKFYHALCCCLATVAAPFAQFGHRQPRNTTYSVKQERLDLVERSVADCPICLQPEQELVLTKGCRHGCCRECLRKYVETDLKNIASYPRKCWMSDCQTLLNYTNVEYVLSTEELEEYDRMLIKSSTSGSNETIGCPLCNAVMLKPRSGEEQGLMQCVNVQCRADLCSRCGVLYHMNQTCEEYAAEMKVKTSGADEEFDRLAKLKKWCKCPNCGQVIERTEGCYHMTHHGCSGGGMERRTDFCYFCGELLMSKNGEGWRFSKRTEERHFENGVYSQCVNVDSASRRNSLSGPNDHGLGFANFDAMMANIRMDLENEPDVYAGHDIEVTL